MCSHIVASVGLDGLSATCFAEAPEVMEELGVGMPDFTAPLEPFGMVYPMLYQSFPPMRQEPCLYQVVCQVH